MARTKIIETEVSTAAVAGSATSITEATVVRLHNDTGSIVTVGVSTVVGAATTNYFTMQYREPAVHCRHSRTFR